MRFLILLFVAVAVVGQPLKDALGLTEMQVLRLRQQHASVQPVDYPVALRVALQNPILNASQQAKLVQIVKALDRWEMAEEAIVAGLMDAKQWPGSTLCLYPIGVHASAFDFSSSQVLELERLQRAKAARDPSLAVLNDAQKARLDAFTRELELVSEAIRWKLIPEPPKGENLCM